MKTANENTWSLFLHKKPVKIILTLKDAENGLMYASTICKLVDCTYPHTLKILKNFESNGLVVFSESEDKRVKTIELTDTGGAIAHDLSEVIMKLNALPDVNKSG